MGRKKITIQKIEQKKDRLITFCKRRLGLLKKAAEISILCDVHVFLAFTDLSGGVFQFDSFRDSETSDRKRDMESTLEKIKTGNFTTYDLSQYPFEELKQQQPVQSDVEREDGLRASSEAGCPRAVGGQEGTTEAAQVRYLNPSSITQIRSSLDRVLHSSSEQPGPSKIHDELRHRGPAFEQREFSEELSASQPPTPSLQLFGEQSHPEPMRQDKYLKKVALVNASLENCRTEQSLWSFIQSKGEDHESLQLDGERLKRIRGRLRRDFLFECSRFKISQTRNDQDVNELVVLYYFLDKYLDLSLHGFGGEQAAFGQRVLGVCSGSVMQALAGSFSFAEALGQEARGRTRVLAEYFLRRFLDPSFHQFSPPNFQLVNSLGHALAGYLQSLNLVLALHGSKSLSSTSFTLDSEQLDLVGRLLDLTLRCLLAKESPARDAQFPATQSVSRLPQPEKRPEAFLPKREHCLCSQQSLGHSQPDQAKPPQPPKEALQASGQEPASGGARIFSGAASVFGGQKALQRPEDPRSKLEPQL